MQKHAALKETSPTTDSRLIFSTAKSLRHMKNQNLFTNQLGNQSLAFRCTQLPVYRNYRTNPADLKHTSA